MKFISLSLRNVFQHKSLTYIFQPGISGIVGRNGSGKSNLIEALYFAISGKTSADVTKAEMLGWGADEGSTLLVFEVGGDTYTLLRRVDSAKVDLAGGDLDKPLKGKAANAFVEAAIGTSFTGMYESCFTPQGGLISVLTMGHAQRVSFFQRLAGLSNVESIRAKIADATTKIPLYLDRSEEIARLKDTIEEHSESLRKSEEILKSATDLEAEYLKKQSSVHALLALPSEEEKEELVRKAHKDLQHAEDMLDSFKDTHEPAYCEPCDPPTDSDGANYEMYQALINARTEVSNAEAEAEAIDRALSKLCVVPDPSETPFYEKLDTVKKDLDAVDLKLHMCTTGSCPTCMREYDTGGLSESKLTADRTSLITDQVRLRKALNTAKEQYESYSEERSSLSFHLKSAENRLRRNAEVVSDSEEALGDFDVDEYLKKQHAYAKFCQYLRDKSTFDTKAANLVEAVTKAKAAYESAESMEACSATAEASCKDFLINLNKIVNTKLRASTDKAAAESIISASEDRLRLAEDEHRKRESSYEASLFLSRARDILHRDNLPKLVMQKILVGLNAQLDSYLSLFETNFTAYINEEFDFMISFGHRSDVSARALSGGQKVALALAFKFAKADLLACQVPIMALDEPTVWLDDINKPKLASILAKARSVTERTSSEVIIATHEPLLMSSFSRIHDVSESGAYAT